MTPSKKEQAVNGSKKYQLEWMMEEINEFYEAIYLGDIDEILDEAIGLIRTAQQFYQSKKVQKKWQLVSHDVMKVLYNRQVFDQAFKKWKDKKTKKGQAKGVVATDLINFANLFD